MITSGSSARCFGICICMFSFLATEGQAAQGTDDDPCTPALGSGTETDPYVFRVTVNLFLASTGYFEFAGCDGVRPTLQIKAGSYYLFDQTSSSNWMHPLGFAYLPDGDHASNPELEPGVQPPGSSSTCASTETCQSPRYYGGKDGNVFLGGSRKGQFLSTESDPVAGVADGAFGLDTYEPQFGDWSVGQWSKNKYNVIVRITDSTTPEIFYFCHIHPWMSGRIRITDANGLPRIGSKATLYDSTRLNDEDKKCGSTPAPHYGDDLGPGAFGPSSGKCATRHLCGANDDFGKCMENIDCQMNYNMRITHVSSDPVKTFMRQMIPHHQNAVNMAKILLKVAKDKVQAADAKLGADAFVEQLMIDIINGQNMQIVMMYEWLATNVNDDPAPIYDPDCSRSLEIGGVVAQNAASRPDASCSILISAVVTVMCIYRLVLFR